MADFPKLSSGSMTVKSPLDDEALAMYPSTVSYNYKTTVHQFLDDSEQRWTSQDAVASMVLEYSSVNGYDMSIIMNFFLARKGMYVNNDLSNTFTIQILGNVYQYCAFEQDELIPVVDDKNTYSFTLKIRQVRRG